MKIKITRATNPKFGFQVAATIRIAAGITSKVIQPNIPTVSEMATPNTKEITTKSIDKLPMLFVVISLS
jgi:hypothetical protein